MNFKSFNSLLVVLKRSIFSKLKTTVLFQLFIVFDVYMYFDHYLYDMMNIYDD